MSYHLINSIHMRKAPLAAVQNNQINAGFWDIVAKGPSAALPYEITAEGIAIIQINGALASADIPYWYYYADMSYENIIATIKHAVNHAEVSAILLKVNSPGGTVTGCAEAAAMIDKLAEKKPIWAHCEMACSAAYWLASATNRILLPVTGMAGSIGVICTHFEYSQHLEKIGIKATPIFSGDTKAYGNPYERLSDEALADIQNDMDILRGAFVSAVSKYRSLDASAVKGTEAKTFIGPDAVNIGLADDVVFYSDTVALMMRDLLSNQTP